MSLNQARILIIEDDAPIRRFLRVALEGEGAEVFEADNGQRGLIDLGTRRPDLLILDLGLPDMDGMAVLSDLRGWSKMPVIILSAREREIDKVAALDAGADDYLIKPFGVPELLARVRAQLRRMTADSGSNISFDFGNINVDLTTRSVRRDGVPVKLTQTEYRLLATLIKAHGRVLTHRQLLIDAWGPGYADRAHYLRIYMGHLRQKLEDDPTQPKYLLTETGVGYRLVVAE